MARNPVLDLPLDQVLRTEIALVLAQLCGAYTVGGFLTQWRNPARAKILVQAFDNPAQAHHAVATCSTWLGVRPKVVRTLPPTWWAGDDAPASAQA